MNIILDTNVLVDDFLLRGTQFQLFAKGTKRLGINLYVPQIVMEETVNQYRERLEGVKAASDKLAQLVETPQVWAFSDSNVESLALGYENS